MDWMDARARIAANHARLTTAIGDLLPPWTSVQEGQAAAAAAWLATAPEDRPGGGWNQGASPAWLPALAAAWRATGDPAHAQGAIALIQAVIDREGQLDDFRPPKDPLALAHRLGGTECVGWLGVLPTLLDAPACDDAALARILTTVRQALDHIIARPHTARNIRMTQKEVLMTAGLRLAGMPGADRWLQDGRRGMRDLLRRQFHPDGSSIEGTGWYHFIVANMALRAWQLDHEYPELELHVDPAAVASAFDYTTAAITPQGTFNLIGDTTHGIGPHRDLAAWLEHRAAVRRELGQPDTPPPVLGWFPDCGQALARSDWRPDATYVTFDASARHGYHWHAARNSLQIHAHGVRLLADPGRLRYDPTPQRIWALRTAAHSTVTLNGWNQSDTVAELQATELAAATVMAGCYGGGYWSFEKSPYEYSQGVFGRHRRTAVWLRDRYVLVVDDVRHSEGEDSKPDLDVHWQFGPGSLSPVADRAWQYASTEGDAGLYLLAALYPAETTAASQTGALEPTCGWVADRSDHPVPAPHLTLGLAKRDPWITSVATVLLPHAGASPAAVPTVTHALAHDDPAAQQGVASLHLTWPDGTRDCIYWRPGGDQGINAVHDPVDDRWLETDAELLLVHLAADGSHTGGLVHRGSYIDGLSAAPILAAGGTWQF